MPRPGALPRAARPSSPAQLRAPSKLLSASAREKGPRQEGTPGHHPSVHRPRIGAPLERDVEVGREHTEPAREEQQRPEGQEIPPAPQEAGKRKQEEEGAHQAHIPRLLEEALGEVASCDVPHPAQEEAQAEEKDECGANGFGPFFERQQRDTVFSTAAPQLNRPSPSFEGAREETVAAYVIITKLRTRNPAELELYAKERPTFLRGHSVTFLARFGRCEVVEGGGVEGVAILEFPTFAEAQAWYASPAYQAASQHRFKGGDYSAVIVEGVAPEPTK